MMTCGSDTLQQSGVDIDRRRCETRPSSICDAWRAARDIVRLQQCPLFPIQDHCFHQNKLDGRIFEESWWTGELAEWREMRCSNDWCWMWWNANEEKTERQCIRRPWPFTFGVIHCQIWTHVQLTEYVFQNVPLYKLWVFFVTKLNWNNNFYSGWKCKVIARSPQGHCKVNHLPYTKYQLPLHGVERGGPWSTRYLSLRAGRNDLAHHLQSYCLRASNSFSCLILANWKTFCVFYFALYSYYLYEVCRLT